MAVFECPSCGKQVSLTLTGRFRPHGPKGDRCEWSGETAPQHAANLPPEEPEKIRVTIGGLGGRMVGTAFMNDDVAEQLKPRVSGLDTGYSYEFPDPFWPEESDVGGYEQPSKLAAAITQAVPMNELELQIAAMFKEIFYQYTNRTGRSAQKELGPSEIGTPCDRRLVMMLMKMPHVNPGGDGWAAFRGTQVHRGLAEMFEWADAGKGRFATEVSVSLPSDLVPHGTADLLDRVLLMVDDHKVQSQWAQDALRVKEMSETYRVQLHVYAYGARMRGEEIERVALISWPSDRPDLDGLYVKSEPYDPEIARAALKRVSDLQASIDISRERGLTDATIAVAALMVPDGCKWCPFYQHDAKDGLGQGGCNGRH